MCDMYLVYLEEKNCLTINCLTIRLIANDCNIFKANDRKDARYLGPIHQVSDRIIHIMFHKIVNVIHKRCSLMNRWNIKYLNYFSAISPTSWIKVTHCMLYCILPEMRSSGILLKNSDVGSRLMLQQICFFSSKGGGSTSSSWAYI